MCVRVCVCVIATKVAKLPAVLTEVTECLDSLAARDYIHTGWFNCLASHFLSPSPFVLLALPLPCAVSHSF